MAVSALIIDDSATASQIIRYHLERLGCRVVGECRSAAEGFERFHKLKPDIITLDLMMPKLENMDSMALLRAVKRDAPDTVVIIVSVIPFEKTQNDFRKEGIFHYIVKPFSQYSFEPVRVKLIRAFPELATTAATS